jgi:hypothetical protein
MTWLKDSLEDLAHDAPPIGDLAQRSRARAQRLRWFNLGGSVTAAAGLAVAGVTAVALVVAGLPGSSPPVPTERTDGVRPAGSSVLGQPIRLPERTPAPLPAGGIGRVALAYTLDCSGVSDRAECASWRVLTADGKHWRVADAMRAGPRGPDKAWGQPSGLAVSPDGRSIAYFREDGTFGIRDVRTGEFRPAFRETSSQVGWDTVAVVWSADGSRVAVSYAFAGPQATGRIVDRESLRVTTLPVSCCVLGLPGGSGDVLMFESGSESTRPRELLAVGADGSVRRRVPFDDVLALADDVRVEYQWSQLSPDGRSLVGLVNVDEGQKESDAFEGDLPAYQTDRRLHVVTISASTGAVDGRHPVSDPTVLHYAKVLGWSGRSELLVAGQAGSSYDEVKTDDPDYAGGTVYAVNVATGVTRRAVSFAGGAEPTLLSVAADLL